MKSDEKHEISVWSDGYEGRFLEWHEETWRAIEHRNYRHVFSKPETPTARDIEALRKFYRVGTSEISDDELIYTFPEILEEKMSLKT